MATNLTYAYAYLMALVEDGKDIDESIKLAAESYCVDPDDLRGMYTDGAEVDQYHF